MTAPTHISFSLIFYFIIAGVSSLFNVNIGTLSIVVLGSLMPDIDTVTSAIGRTLFPIAAAIEKKWGHRTITHSFVGVGIAGIIALPVLYFSHNYYYAFLIGYLSHILIDCCNKKGPTIFWPSSIRAVLPGRKEFRIQVASSAEFILLAVFVVMSGVLYPVAHRGFTKSLHWLLGDIRSAVLDYHDYATNNESYIDLEAVDNVTYEKIKGKFKIVGSTGRGTLVIACSPELRTVGNYDNDNWRPVKARVVKGEPIKIVTQEVDLSHRVLGDIEYFLDKSQDQRLYGSVEVIDQANVPYLPGLYNPVDVKGKNLVLTHATLKDIEKLNLSEVYIKEGKLLIKTDLKESEHLTNVDSKKAEMLKNRFSEKYDIAFSIENKDEVLVKRGETISQGQVIARVRRKIKEVKAIEEELSALNKQKGIIVAGKKQLRRKVEVLKLQKALQKREWENLQAEKTQLEIEEAEKELSLESNSEEIKLQRQIADLKLRKDDAQGKAVIKSQVSGIIADVEYSMTLEYLTRVQITVLVKS
jgi:inner membrane protein